MLEISSGDEEEFSVAPSRRTTEGGGEEEEQDQKTGAERREGRSKKRHDKPVGCPAGTPLKRKAEAAPAGASGGGITSWLRCSVQWLDSTAPKSGYVLACRALVSFAWFFSLLEFLYSLLDRDLVQGKCRKLRKATDV